MFQCPNIGRHAMTLLVVGLLGAILAGCPPRKPTPTVAPTAALADINEAVVTLPYGKLRMALYIRGSHLVARTLA